MERRATRTRTTLAVSMLGVDANRANSGGVKGSEIATPRCRVQSVSRRCRIAPCRVPGPRMARGVGHFGVPRLLSKRRPTDTFMKPIALSLDAIGAADLSGRARAFQSLVGGGLDPLKAMTLAGLMDAED